MRKVSKSEELSMDSSATLLLEECRMVLPGIQALFGFQLIAVFSPGFSEKLSSGEQNLHFVSIVLVVISEHLSWRPQRFTDNGTLFQSVIGLFTWHPNCCCSACGHWQ